MASYGINIFDDGSGNFTATVERAPTTISSGGTILQIPHIQDNSQQGDNLATITGATNATPIVVTAANNFSNNDVVTINGALGNTGANGTFQLSSVSSTGFTLVNSVGNGAWTSGGYALKLSPTRILGVMVQSALRAVQNDRSLNG
jgi:hypothetical protein